MYGGESLGTVYVVFPHMSSSLPPSVQLISQRIFSSLEAWQNNADDGGRPATRDTQRIAAQLNTARAELLETINSYSHEVKNPEIAPVSPVVTVLLAKL